jgi:hypothetical protein
MEFLRGLTEARVFRGPKDVEGLPQKMADITYLHFLMFNIMRYELPEFSTAYAHKVMQFPNFDIIRNSASDFGNLLAAMNNPEKYLASDRSKYNFPILQLRRWFRDVQVKDLLFDRRFFLQLEDGLKQDRGIIHQLRRVVTEWKFSDESERKDAASRIYRFLYNSSYNDDLFIKFKDLCKKRHWIN